MERDRKRSGTVRACYAGRVRWSVPAVTVVALLAVGSAGAPRTTIEADAGLSRPNLVVILADDQTAESMRVMTRTRRLLGAEGTTFANAFVAFPLCCPSRATLLTGQHAHNHGVRGNSAPAGGYGRLDHRNTLPVWLQAAGSSTAHLGKYLNGYGIAAPPDVPPGWSRWFGLVDPGTYGMYDYTVNDDGALVRYGDSAADYQTDVLAAEAVELIRRRAGEEDPFFLVVAPLAPHLENSDQVGRGQPPRPAPRHRGRFAGEPLPAKASIDEADVGDKPRFVRRQRRLGAPQRAAVLARYRGQLASLLALDELVERVVAALDEVGELDRTVILYTSDNGFFHGEHRIADGKFLPYEEAIHVPLLVRGPGFPAGHVAPQPVSNVDLAPTLVALSGAHAGRTMDGRSLLPVALDPRAGRGRALLIEGLVGNRPSYAALRSERWLWVEYAGGERELYDLAKDPLQLRSLHAAKAHAGRRAELSRRLAALRACAGPGCG
jgi:arylsulfatase A-like enzyme